MELGKSFSNKFSSQRGGAGHMHLALSGFRELEMRNRQGKSQNNRHTLLHNKPGAVIFTKSALKIT